MSRRRIGLALILSATAACGSGEQKPAQRADTVERPAGGGMPDMEGMGSMGSQGMMREMRAHMQAMSGASADSLRRLMPTHRQMTANMLQQMDTEMRGMQMTADTSWTALADSVRQDLTRLPDVSTAELREFMKLHQARVARLMARHEQMMGDSR